MEKYLYKVIRFDLGKKYSEGVKKDGAENLEKELNKYAKEGFRVIQALEEHEGLVSKKALILEKSTEYNEE